MPTNVPQVIPDRRTEVKENIVVQKFADMSSLTNDFYELVKTYVQEITDIVRSMPDIDNTVTVPDVDLTPVDTNKLEELLRDMPTDPLANVVWPPVPTDNLDFQEDVDYSDDLFTLFDTELQNVLADTSALINASIQDDMVDMEDERDAIINQDAKTNKAADWAESGFETPGSGLFSVQGQVDVDYQNKKLDKSRDVRVRTVEQEIANKQKLHEEINKFEATRMEFKAGYWQRKLDASKAILERGTVIFTASVEIIKAQATTYQAIAAAYASHAGALAEIAKTKYQDIRARVEYAAVQVNAAIAELNSKVEEIKTKYGISMDGAKVQGNIAAQVMASALAAVSASAVISSTDNATVSSSISASETWEHYMDESEPPT
jgi:hypothetical protein